MPETVFLLTGAHIIKNANEVLLKERFTEYMVSLHKVFSYNKPVYGVLSEYIESLPYTPPFKQFNFNNLVLLSPDKLSMCTTKSQREFMSIKSMLSEMNNLADDTFIIKLSGRYIILKDTIFNISEEIKNNININAIVHLTKEVAPLQQFTFLFALRWKWFKQFYSQPLEELGEKCVERFIIEFFEKNNLQQSILHVDELGVLANIDNQGKYTIY